MTNDIEHESHNCVYSVECAIGGSYGMFSTEKDAQNFVRKLETAFPKIVNEYRPFGQVFYVEEVDIDIFKEKSIDEIKLKFGKELDYSYEKFSRSLL